MNEGAPQLAGQWIGLSDGDPPAAIVIDLDPIEGDARGIAYLFPQDSSLPSSFAFLNVANVLQNFEVESEHRHFYPDTGQVFDEKQHNEAIAAGTAPRQVKAKFYVLNDNELRVGWKTEIGTFGEATLTRMIRRNRSSLECEKGVHDWRSYQDFVTTDLSEGHIFRGQSYPWPLQSSFHRTNRKNLLRYISEDVPRLHRALTARTSHIFDLMQPQQNGAFLNLAQHHGFPTPLLDWTFSPFVAAYFAYENAISKPNEDPVRVYAFNQRMYCKRFFQHQTLTFTRPHFSILEALSIENERAVPQQGLLSLTNIQDIERFLEFQERQTGERYILAFDLLRSEAAKALHDLRLMGITEATLFPGIESICKDLRRRYFHS